MIYAIDIAIAIAIDIDIDIDIDLNCRVICFIYNQFLYFIFYFLVPVF